MKQNKGFSLIELVVVIVVLGVLAVTAAPKFLNIQVDARNAKIDEMKGVMTSTAGVMFAKSIMQGQENTMKGKVSVDGRVIDTVYGYPDADEILELIGIDKSEWSVIYNVKRQGVTIKLGDASGDFLTDLKTGCYVRYQFNHYNNGEERLKVTTSACK